MRFLGRKRKRKIMARTKVIESCASLFGLRSGPSTEWWDEFSTGEGAKQNTGVLPLRLALLAQGQNDKAK